MIGPCRSIQEYLNGLAFRLAPREIEVVMALHWNPEGLTSAQISTIIYKVSFLEDRRCIWQHVSKTNQKCARMGIPPLIESVRKGKRYFLSEFLIRLPSQPLIHAQR